MTPPPKLFKSDKTVVTPPRTPRKVKPTSPEAEKEVETPTLEKAGPIKGGSHIRFSIYQTVIKCVLLTTFFVAKLILI